MFVDPQVERQQLITIRVPDVRWDNLLDTILLTRDLAMEREANVVRIFAVRTDDDAIVSSVISLKHVPTSTFESFSGWLAPGGLSVDAPSGTLVVRDVRAKVAWFRRFAEAVDEMGAPELP